MSDAFRTMDFFFVNFTTVSRVVARRAPSGRHTSARGSGSGCARGRRNRRRATRATADGADGRRRRRRCRRRRRRRRCERARGEGTEVRFVFRVDGRLETARVMGATMAMMDVSSRIRLRLRRSSSSLERSNDDRCAGRSARANAARATASSRALGAKAGDGRTFRRVGRSCRKGSGLSGVRIVEGAGGARAWIVSGTGRIANPSGFGCSRRVSLNCF